MYSSLSLVPSTEGRECDDASDGLPIEISLLPHFTWDIWLGFLELASLQSSSHESLVFLSTVETHRIRRSKFHLQTPDESSLLAVQIARIPLPFRLQSLEEVNLLPARPKVHARREARRSAFCCLPPSSLPFDSSLRPSSPSLDIQVSSSATSSSSLQRPEKDEANRLTWRTAKRPSTSPRNPFPRHERGEQAAKRTARRSRRCWFWLPR